MLLNILLVLVGIIFIVHTGLRFLDSLHMFQQNVYGTRRYFTWMGRNTHKVLPFVDIMPLLLVLALFFFPSTRTVYVILLIIATFYLIKGFFMYRKRKEFVKLPLVYTPRTIRLIITSSLLVLLTFVGSYFLTQYLQPKIGMFFVLQAYVLVNLFIYLFVWIANILNYPIESSIRKRFIRDAHSKILAMKDSIDVVGITGSYGKTTTKNIVAHILNEDRYALMTPASFNTPMGLTITIREYLKPIHEVFVAEMGAYRRGEIKELADIVLPKYGILTAIGPQHLNTFGSIDNVENTKFELIESLDADGVAILNIDDPRIRNHQTQTSAKIYTYSILDDTADFFAKDIEYASDGISFTIVFPDKNEYQFSTMLLGEHNIQNILAATAVAYDMGIPVEKIVHGVATLPQIEHRLELKPAGSFTIIDDAFNANPVGTKKAIDVLSKMEGKKIVMTPGMIDLGKEEKELNYAYGEYMADKVDTVILVGQQQTIPIYEGLIASGMQQEQIHVVNNLQAAFDQMYREAVPGSYVLIANDLPDTYNE